jgi:hypothetical protein
MYGNYTSEVLDKHSSTGLIHTGSWKVHIGNIQNQYVHIWMYKNFAHLDQFIGNLKVKLLFNVQIKYVCRFLILVLYLFLFSFVKFI